MNLLLAYVGSPRFRRAMGSKPGQKGFSLIELIIAVAVIAILSAAVLPQFANQSVKAAKSKALFIGFRSSTRTRLNFDYTTAYSACPIRTMKPTSWM